MSSFEMQPAPQDDPGKIFDSYKVNIGKEVSKFITKTLDSRLSEQSPIGRETGFSGKFTEIVAGAFDGQLITLKDSDFVIRVKASLFRPVKEEKNTGSDIAIYFEVISKLPPPYKIWRSKTLLVQAKTGEIDKDNKIKCTNKDLPSQITTINKFSPDDGFILIFTTNGGYCVQIKDAIDGLNKKTLTTSNYSPAGDIIGKIINCTAGNVEKISPAYLNVNRNDSGFIALDDANEKLSRYGQLFQVKKAKKARTPANAVAVTFTIDKV